MTAWGELMPASWEPNNPESEGTLVLVAHEEGASFFLVRKHRPVGRPLQKIADMPRGLDVALEPRKFAQQLALMVDELLNERPGSDLALLAEPRLLTPLRWSLSPDAGRAVRVSMVGSWRDADEIAIATALGLTS